MIFGVEKFEKS